MSKRNLYAFVLLLAAQMLMAKDKVIMPAIVTHATYVMVTTYNGDEFSPRVTPDDRQAISDVQKALQKWGRYNLVYTPNQAELLIVVRTGRLVEAHAGIQLGTSNRAPHSSGELVGVENGDPLDTLDIYDGARGLDSSPLWRGRAAAGLKEPELSLVKEFRTKVEAAAAKKP